VDGAGLVVFLENEHVVPISVLRLPKDLELRVKRRELSLKRARKSTRLGLSKKAAKTTTAKLKAAEAKRSEVLESRCKRARALADSTAVDQKRIKQRIRECVREAARTARERGAKERREGEILVLKARAAEKNKRVASVRNAMKTKLEDERSSRQEALANRLQLAAARREEAKKTTSLRRTSRGSSFDQGSDSARTSRACTVIQRSWRKFSRSKVSTVKVMEAFHSHLRRSKILALIRVNNKDSTTTPPGSGSETNDNAIFQQFQRMVRIMQNPVVLRAAQNALRRIEERGRVTSATSFVGKAARLDNLLKSIHPKTHKGVVQRYPTRVFLSSFMIVLHPELVLNSQGAVQDLLKKAAVDLISSFQNLLQKANTTEKKKKKGETEEGSRSFAALIEEFDDHWLSFLGSFASWKKGDVLVLERDLIQKACDLTLSVLRKCGPDFTAPRVRIHPDLQAIAHQLSLDISLIRTSVKILTGEAGTAKFDDAIRSCRADFEIDLETSKQQYESDVIVDTKGEEQEQEQGSLPQYEDLNNKKFLQDWKTKVVHELLHDPNYELLPINSAINSKGFGVENVECFESNFENVIDISSASGKISAGKVVERAFWDAVLEDLIDSSSSYESIVGLLKELQEGIGRICNLDRHRSYDSTQYIEDLERNPDTEHFLSAAERIFNSLCDLGAPVREDAARATFAKFKLELSEQGGNNPSDTARYVCATVRFLHTLYEVLNADIVNGQVKALRAMYHGNAAIDYLAECFQKKHDLSYDNCASVKLALPKTEACLKGTKEWMRSLSEQLSINTDGRESSAFSFKMKSGIGSSSTMEESEEDHITDSKGLPKAHLDIFSSIILQTMSQDTTLKLRLLPELLEMDHKRLVNLQNTFQRLVVLSAACLLLHQLVGRQGAEEVESLKDAFARRVNALLLHPETKLSHLSSELYNLLAQQNGDSALAADEESISNLLQKLLDEDSVALKSLKKNILSALFIALMEVDGRAKTSSNLNVLKQLRKAGAAVLYDKVVESAEKIRIISIISCKIHGRVLDTMIDECTL
jgi:hypothetical protein